MKIKFSVPAVPVAQPRQRHRIAGKPGSQFVQNYVSKTAPVNAYKATCRVAAAQSGLRVVLEGPIALRAVFVLPRPSALCWKAKPTPRVPHSKKPDGDNLAKSLLDALNGTVWRDDSQICRMVIEKWIASGSEQPHVEVEIETVS